MSGFQKAEKTKSMLRMTLYGPPGSGKTYSALSMAKGMQSVAGGRIALLDSERGSASKYGDRFDFDVRDLEKRSIPEYMEAIKEAGNAGYTVLVIDSMTHAWKWLVDKVEQIAAAKYKSHKGAAWAEGTQIQDDFIDLILRYPGHIIATMRTKIEYAFEANENGKVGMKRIGTAPQQRGDLEYEFDLVGELNKDHLMTIHKDRTQKFQDAIIEKPGEQFGKELVEWLSEGADPEPQKAKPTHREVIDRMKEMAKKPTRKAVDWAKNYCRNNKQHMTEAEYMEAMDLLQAAESNLEKAA